MSLRNDLVGEVRKYLVGPREPDEVLHERPEEYYTSGILFPRDAEVDSFDTENPEVDGYDEVEEKNVSIQVEPLTRQSSMGLHVNIRDGVNRVGLEIIYSKYTNANGCWRRLAPVRENHTIALDKREDRIDIRGAGGTVEAELRWKLGEVGYGSEKHRVLNCSLSNAATWIKHKTGSDFASAKDQNSRGTIFQPSIRIHSDRPIFSDHWLRAGGVLHTAENKSLDLIFANTAYYGRGSNCAAVWEREIEPRWVATEFVPTYVAPGIGKESDGSDGRPSRIDMHRLSYTEGDYRDGQYMKHLEKTIRPLTDSYGEWIGAEKKGIRNLDKNAKLTAAANDHIHKCTEAHRRMEDGLEFLLDANNEKARLAFALANRAMLWQRIRYEYSLMVAEGRKPSCRNPTEPEQAFWYPFQLAFFVMNVRGIADESSGERDVVDLLWFPTGGGKTEAYLAVAAFAMIYRRLKANGKDGGLGVSVIMRYTLRLLTLQQFERASTLMCALEFIRINHPEYGLGEDPFLIGLWVGYNLTPNTAEKSRKAIDGERRGDRILEGSPVQHTHCPWCGDRIDAYCYAVDSRSDWTIVHCKNKSCFFYSRNKTDTKRALPVLTVDDDIYRRCPAMIIATVDKFARMPYKEKIASIFGRVDRRCGKHGFLAPGDGCGARSHRDSSIIRIHKLDGPDLIIWDELHLISGPLGSMVGLYETAVDYLSRRGTTVPKIIASTATIRGADDQARKIFNRKRPHKFPPPGTRREDSFFWWELKDRGRQYVGTSFSYRSAKYSLARIYASLLQTAKTAIAAHGTDVVDPYWTLVGYFNSIRELGGAIRLVEDDVVDNIKFIAETLHGGQERRDPGRPSDGLEELTGRKGQAEILEIRRNLCKTVNIPGCISTLLATNMISVGIDIKRLGVMVVNGQTKSVSEYIQATGRIGRTRDVPGLVFTLYNPYKPRDLSHYEDFYGYHSMLQRYVEPSTLTPFSVGSVERGMHAVLTAMVRLSTPRLSGNYSASRFDVDGARDAISFILDRYEQVQQVGPDTNCYREIKKHLETFVCEWEKSVRQTDNATKICYTGADDHLTMLSDFGAPPDKVDFPRSTPDSLRNVERQVNLLYKTR